MATIRYWPNTNQLIASLREFDWQTALVQKRSLQTTDLAELVKRSVSANTFRGFAGQQPSLIFRPWATRTFSGEARDDLLCIERRRDYDDWLARVAANLERHWKNESHVRIACGPKYKLLDLLLKVLCESTIIPDHVWQKLVWLIHVPLDKHVLLGLRSCVRHFPNHASIGVIPENPTMSFITSHEAYVAFQDGIRGLADEAGVPAIALDYLAWDGVH